MDEMTIGTRLFTWLYGELVGTDPFGNRYYLDKRTRGQKRERRWVLYNGYADASKVSPDWHGWLHHTFVEPPTQAPLRRPRWEKDHLPNLSGTPFAYRPKGSLAGRGQRAPATGDYQPWRPE